MWILAKYKYSEFNLMRENLKKIFGEKIKIYRPLLKIQTFKKNKLEFKRKTLLGDYIFLSHEKFNDNYFVNKINYIKGIKMSFKNSIFSQADISKFINHCEKNSVNGFVTHSFFETISKRNIFISGPFTSLVFNILSESKKTCEIMVGHLKMNIKKGSNFLYRPI